MPYLTALQMSRHRRVGCLMADVVILGENAPCLSVLCLMTSVAAQGQTQLTGAKR